MDTESPRNLLKFRVSCDSGTGDSSASYEITKDTLSVIDSFRSNRECRSNDLIKFCLLVIIGFDLFGLYLTVIIVRLVSSLIVRVPIGLSGAKRVCRF